MPVHTSIPDGTVFPSDFFDRIKAQRKKRGWTLEEVENLTGISKKTLIRLEKGEDVRLSTLVCVLKLLGITLAFDHVPTVNREDAVAAKEIRKYELTEENKDGWF